MTASLDHWFKPQPADPRYCGAELHDSNGSPYTCAAVAEDHPVAPAEPAPPAAPRGFYAGQLPARPYPLPARPYPPGTRDPDLHPAGLSDAALYGLTGDVVRAIAPHTEADSAAVAFTFLTVAGFLIGRNPVYRIGSVRHSPALFVVLVGDTARARKGTSWHDVAQIWERIDPDLHTRIAGGFQSGEAIVARVRDADPDDGADDAPRDRRLLVHEGEFARILKVGDRDGSILTELIRDAWDGKPLQIRTKSQTMTATGAHIAMLGHVTRDELARTLSETNRVNGFGNRILFVSVSRSKLLADVEPVPEHILDDLAGRLRRAVLAPPATIRKSPAAKRWWKPRYEAQQLDDPPGLIGHQVARDTDHIQRMAIIYAVLDGSPAVEVVHLEAAFEMYRYARDSVPLVFGRSAGDAVADRLRSRIAAAGRDGLSLSEQRDVFSRNVTADRLAEVRRPMLESGELEEFEVRTKGRPQIRHRMVDRGTR
jgi:hypothetical protein